MVFFLQITLHSFHSVAEVSICLIRHCKLSVTLRYVTLRWGPTSAIMWPFLLYGIWTLEFLLVSYSSSFCFHSLSVPLSQLLSPTLYHRSCYRPFPVFHREFTGGRSVPRERREVHRVREDQGPNLLSRDLPRTSQTPPELVRNVMFCDGQFDLLPAEQPLAVVFAPGIQLNLKVVCRPWGKCSDTVQLYAYLNSSVTIDGSKNLTKGNSLQIVWT